LADPHITVLMATLNGAQFLPAQLDSLLAQTHANWSLMVSDDGSRDGTADILRAFDRAHPNRNVRLLEGPRSGTPAQNFMALLTHRDVPAGYLALADQDDVWLPQKLARAVDHLSRGPQNLPAIYGAESILTDAALQPIGRTAEPHATPGFRNALVQNLFAGHSIALNPAALALVRDAGAPPNIYFHDWWLYQLIAGAGGTCLLDPAQTTLYRQHGSNAFGGSHGIKGILRRLNHLLRNDYGTWLTAHWQALQNAAPHLTPDARDLIRDLLDRPADQNRAAQFRRLGLKRGSAHGTAALWLAARLGHI
jgi:glycosyltransferase involved in cell wall biosynthesis